MSSTIEPLLPRCRVNEALRRLRMGDLFKIDHSTSIGKIKIAYERAKSPIKWITHLGDDPYQNLVEDKVQRARYGIQSIPDLSI